jgi:hypothetical protein
VECASDYSRIFRFGSGLCGCYIDYETLEIKMRTKVLIDGLKNTQKFRAIINGIIIGDCQVKDLMGNRFQQVDQRVAVWESLMDIAMRRRHGLNMTGFAGNKRGYEVQVDLV